MKMKRTLHSSRRLSFNELTNAKNFVSHCSHFAIMQILRSAHTGYLCVFRVYQNKERLFPYIYMSGFYNRDGVCLLRGTDWIFKYRGLSLTLVFKTNFIFWGAKRSPLKVIRVYLYNAVLQYKMQPKRSTSFLRWKFPAFQSHYATPLTSKHLTIFPTYVYWINEWTLPGNLYNTKMF